MRILILLANIAYPAFSAPQHLCFTFPFLTLCAIFSEVAVYKLYFKVFTWRKIGICTLFANLASWLINVTVVGLLLPILPTGLEGMAGLPSTEFSPSYYYLLTASFSFAYLLSVGIEGVYLLSVLKIRKPEHFWKTIFVAHLFSYAIMIVFGVGRQYYF